MGYLTTHVLDLSAGVPAGGLQVELHEWPTGKAVCSVYTGINGRCDPALIEGAAFHRGGYLLTFHAAEYFRARKVTLPDPPFFDQIAVRVGIARPDEHYHVPLLISPWSYSVYRGG
ncbi:MAG: hydroxyisourate hydrolase [Gammaproteobacteria bacterium]|nr:hydroxyisourate hydrolase [Gammaproteobacteria bacterium]